MNKATLILFFIVSSIASAQTLRSPESNAIEYHFPQNIDSILNQYFEFIDSSGYKQLISPWNEKQNYYLILGMKYGKIDSSFSLLNTISIRAQDHKLTMKQFNLPCDDSLTVGYILARSNRYAIIGKHSRIPVVFLSDWGFSVCNTNVEDYERLVALQYTEGMNLIYNIFDPYKVNKGWSVDYKEGRKILESWIIY